MTRPQVYVTRRLPEPVERELGVDFEVRLNSTDAPADADTLRAALRENDALLCTVTDRIDRSVLSGGPHRARILANFGVGHDHIDVGEARRLGLVVTNTPGVLTDATADLTIALMLMVARRMGEGERELRSGRWTGWRPTHMIGRSISGRTLGIVGMGRIGQAVARRAQAGFGMRILYYTRSPVTFPGLIAERCDRLEALLGESDFVSLHTPATSETRHLMDAARFAQMRRTAFLINTARGDLVDESALVRALRDQTIAGAGLDVYASEPNVPGALLQHENVVVLPHLGSATDEARIAMGRRAHANLRAYFSGRPVPDPVVS